MRNYESRKERMYRRTSNTIWVGVFLFFAGLLMLGYKLGLPLPGWLFTWPMILIVIGLGIGLKDRFQNAGAWILILIGSIFLADQNFQGFNFKQFIFPAILIMIGLIYIVRPRQRKEEQWQESVGGNTGNSLAEDAPSDTPEGNIDPEYVNINSLFGGVKRMIFSKNFKGGTVTTFMGGAELNLLQSDMQGPVFLEVNNVFGGTKLIVPSNWDIQNDVTAIFGGVEDKRNLQMLKPDPMKKVFIKGTSLFGGIEIANH